MRTCTYIRKSRLFWRQYQLYGIINDDFAKMKLDRYTCIIIYFHFHVSHFNIKMCIMKLKMIIDQIKDKIIIIIKLWICNYITSGLKYTCFSKFDVRLC